MAGILSSLLTAIAIPLVYWWLARKFPAPQLEAEGPTLEELAPKYRRWEVAFTVIYIVAWFLVSAVVYAPLHLVAVWRAEAMQVDRSSFVFYVDGAALWIPAFFMALLLSGYLVAALLRSILEDRYVEYERYSALRFGFDQNRVMKGFAVTITLAFVIGVLAMFDTYVVASGNELRLNPLLGVERRYAYSDVSAIITAPAIVAPNGNTVYRRVYVMQFKDGSRFSTDSIPDNELLGRSHAALIEAIAQRSDVPAFEKAILERTDL